jgi:4-nitrophenyl phosphatase
MDGVLWRDHEPLPAASELLTTLTREGLPFQLATNNSTKTIAEYVEKCHKLGFPVSGEQILTSVLLTLDWLTAHLALGATVYPVGSPSLHGWITERGFRIGTEAVAAVVVGLDPQLSYEKLKWAHRAIMDGAVFIATNADATFPAADGTNPGAGSIVAAIERSTGKTPVIMGKPNPLMFASAVARMGKTPGETLMIGDRLETDIIGAHAVGLQTGLVLTGISRREDIPKDAPYPTLILDSLAQLLIP